MLAESRHPAASRFNYFIAGGMAVMAAVIAHGTFFVTRPKGDISMPLVFPSVLISALLTLAVVLVLKTRASALPLPDGEPISLAGHAKAGVIFAIALAYPMVMQIISFPIATALALVAFCLALGERRFWLIALYALAFTAFVYGVFIMMLRVPLPMGIFE